jgi:hypothetical protein
MKCNLAKGRLVFLVDSKSSRRMHIPKNFVISAFIVLLPLFAYAPFAQESGDSVFYTSVSIAGENFQINGRPTYEGRIWNGHNIQGLLLNARLVQGIFDDLNTESASRWAYPDTGRWNAERNMREFIAAMPEWRKHGLLAFNLNLQGGSPVGYRTVLEWNNTAFVANGSLRPDYFARLERILKRADELGMVVILGYFYFGQDQRLTDEAAVIRATDNATQWLLNHGWKNVIVEINNECDIKAYDHAILWPDRVHELISRVHNTK